MSRRDWPPVSVDFDPIPASSLCQVVTGNQSSTECDEHCDCRHRSIVRKRKRLPHGLGRRTIGVWADWNISVDSFSGTAVTYVPRFDHDIGHELITEPELAGLL